MRITTILGTRPEVIKMAPVLERLRVSPHVDSNVCITSQHRMLLPQMLDEFGIHPDYSIDNPESAGSTASVVSWMLSGLDAVLERTRPDLVLVQGDTASVLAGAMAASLQGIPVGHVEAGLRTGDPAAPFPEELIRVTVSRLARYHFATTATGYRNLISEGIPVEHVHVTGSTVVDALQEALAGTQHWSMVDCHQYYGAELCHRLVRHDRRMILVTGHRRENLSRRLANVCHAVMALATRHPDWDFVFPVHLNPLVQGQVRAILGGIGNVYLLPPLAYRRFVYLMMFADLIITDSGGIQEEAPYLGIPVLVTREITDRPESVEAGFASLVGGDMALICAEAERIIAKRADGLELEPTQDLYGDGRASQRIVGLLESISIDGYVDAGLRNQDAVRTSPPDRWVRARSGSIRKTG